MTIVKAEARRHPHSGRWTGARAAGGRRGLGRGRGRGRGRLASGYRRRRLAGGYRRGRLASGCRRGLGAGRGSRRLAGDRLQVTLGRRRRDLQIRRLGREPHRPSRPQRRRPAGATTQPSPSAPGVNSACFRRARS